MALVQLTHDGTGTDHDALVARIERLETTVKQLKAQGGAAAPAVPKDPATGRAVLGGAARRPDRPATPAPEPAPESQPADATDGTTPPADAPAEVAEVAEVAANDSAPSPPVEAAPSPTVSVPDAWEQTVKSQVKPLVRALYSAGSFVGNRGDTWLFSVPNEAHGTKCNEHRADVEAALSRAVGGPVTIEFVSGGSPVHDSGHEAGASSGPVAHASKPPSRPETEATPTTEHARTAEPAEPQTERHAEPSPNGPEAD